MFKIWKTAEPTTMKRKNPNRTGPTGNLSSFFYVLTLIYIILLMRKALSLSSQCSFDMLRSLLSFSSDSISFISVSFLPFFIYSLFIIIIVLFIFLFILKLSYIAICSIVRLEITSILLSFFGNKDKQESLHI